MKIGQVRRDEGKLVELVWRKMPSGSVLAGQTDNGFQGREN
jgi:hypothetical protein